MQILEGPDVQPTAGMFDSAPIASKLHPVKQWWFSTTQRLVLITSAVVIHDVQRFCKTSTVVHHKTGQSCTLCLYESPCRVDHEGKQIQANRVKSIALLDMLGHLQSAGRLMLTIILMMLCQLPS